MTSRRAFALGLASLAASCARDPGLARLALGEKGKAVTVRSGEVIGLDSSLEVRLAGIEAPNGTEPLADQAHAYLSGAALGKPVSLLYGGLRRDRYARALAHVRVDGGRAWLQGELLSRGLARVRTYPDNRALAAEMLEIEARARIARKGMWAVPDYAVLLPYECPGKEGFQIVEGRINRVSTIGPGVNLDLLGGGAQVQIPRRAVPDFGAAGRTLDTLNGRLIRVRGVLRDGVVRLDHPETLELLRAA